VVQPGTSFRKAWKVRNDGSYPWPEGSSLVSVGGDVMSDPNHKEGLPVIRPEEDAEIALQLTAPDLPGMYTAYYRAQTKEQQYFGQRLWASIVVAESESDWQVVSEDKQKAAAAEKSSSSKNEQQKPEQPPVVVAPGVHTAEPSAPEAREEFKEPEQQQPSVVGAAAPVVLLNNNNVEVPAAPAVVQQQPAGFRSAILLWRRELEVLDAMGFSDPTASIPLLQQFLGSPLSLSADKNATPNVEGMQQVVATLLQMN